MTQGEPIGERVIAPRRQETLYDASDEAWAEEVGEAVLAAGHLARALRELALDRGHVGLLPTLDAIQKIKDELADVYRSEIIRSRRD